MKVETSKSSEQDLTADLEKEYTLKKQTLEMLPDAANNIKRLQGDVQNQAKKLVTLAGTEFSLTLCICLGDNYITVYIN
jgi:hypothetical protein